MADEEQNSEQEKQPSQDEEQLPDNEESERQETETEKPEEPKKSGSGRRWQRFAGWYKTNKKKSLPLTVVVVLLLLAAVPWSRYHIVGLVHKRDLQLKVVDASANTPVSGATVSTGSISAETNGTGTVTLHDVSVGYHQVTIAKKYYDTATENVLFPILKQKTVPSVALVATGRQVKIVVTNLISGAKLSGVDIKAGGIKAKTDDNGSATIVIAAGVSSAKATLSADGYNNADVTIQASDKEIKENDFKLTPAGKVYFLSKLSGNIDVVKTNLDGTDRETVLAGTGNEDDRGTVLLASRDWKYLALLSRRDNSSDPKLYLISTADDSLTVMDTAAATFTPVGWSGDNFIYTAARDGSLAWQPNQQALKSYNAATKQIIILDQTKGEGTNGNDYMQEQYGQVYQVGNTIVYSKTWSWGYAASLSPGWSTPKNHGIYSISASGTNPQTLKTFSVQDNGVGFWIYSIPYKADQIYYQVYISGNPTYYEYQNGKISQSDSDAADEFNQYQQNQITYLQSPSGNNTFWAESRDGKNTLFIGDTSGENGKQIATLSEYQAYGWYTDNYLLVSKDSSELYIMPTKGIKSDSDAIKITDYHKPAQTFYGYGGGYGGI